MTSRSDLAWRRESGLATSATWYSGRATGTSDRAQLAPASRRSPPRRGCCCCCCCHCCACAYCCPVVSLVVLLVQLLPLLMRRASKQLRWSARRPGGPATRWWRRARDGRGALVQPVDGAAQRAQDADWQGHGLRREQRASWSLWYCCAKRRGDAAATGRARRRRQAPVARPGRLGARAFGLMGGRCGHGRGGRGGRGWRGRHGAGA
jgi:hypothetical protein